jgi:beta-lactamase superfamily II metal-dependent hydrolase
VLKSVDTWRRRSVVIVHFLNVGCGDASAIITPTGTFLVDCHNIGDHRHVLPASKVLRAVFITHQHFDHYSGLAYLRDNRYAIQYLIYSPYDRRYGDTSVTLEEWNEFASIRDYFQRQGTKLYTPYKQDRWENPYWSVDGLKFWMLGPRASIAQSDTRELHDACLVFRADMGARICTFTGDASDTNLADVATLNNICGDILHASHHGSMNGANLDFVRKCRASWTVISTACGRYDNVPCPEALERYRANSIGGVWRTDANGSCCWQF